MLHAEVVSAKLSILMYTDNWYVVTNNTRLFQSNTAPQPLFTESISNDNLSMICIITTRPT